MQMNRVVTNQDADICGVVRLCQTHSHMVNKHTEWEVELIELYIIFVIVLISCGPLNRGWGAAAPQRSFSVCLYSKLEWSFTSL